MHQQQHNKSLDVRAKQRLSYHVVFLSLAGVYSVSPHVNSIVSWLVVSTQWKLFAETADNIG